MSPRSPLPKRQSADARWRRPAYSLVVAMLAAALGGLGAFVAIFGFVAPQPAVAYFSACRGHHPHENEINGKTENAINPYDPDSAVIHRTFQEIGAGGSWDPEPESKMGGGWTNNWCAVANPFPLATAAMKVNYRLPDGTIAHFDAWIAFAGNRSDQGCSISGQHTHYVCEAKEVAKAKRILWVKFIVRPK